MKIKIITLVLAMAGTMITVDNVIAANWLMLQGAEKPGVSGRARVWGFIQPEYQSTGDKKLAAGGWSGQSAIFNQMRPNLTSASGFNVIRARLGVRGIAMPLDSNVNYFLLTEFGNNGITNSAGGGGDTELTDASITLNHIKGARIRVGQFKYPGSEEGLQAIHVFDYINFTNVTNQMLLERFFAGDGSGTPGNGNGDTDGNAATNESTDVVNAPTRPVGAFRDIGVQVFDSFAQGGWDHSYAVMIGNGGGINRSNPDSNMDTYLYLASEKIFSGKGPRRDGLKIIAWSQTGKRTLTTVGEGAGTYDRNRTGFGAFYRKGKIRTGFEYIDAKGMIFNGTDGAALPGAISNNVNPVAASFNVLPTGTANGYYFDFGYYITPKLTIDIRYDTLNRGTQAAAAERTFTTTTIGTQYFFNKKSRVLANYEARTAGAPANTGANNILSNSIDNRISLQLLTIF